MSMVDREPDSSRNLRFGQDGPFIDERPAKWERDRIGLDSTGRPIGQGRPEGRSRICPAFTDSYITLDFSGEQPTTTPARPSP